MTSTARPWSYALKTEFSGQFENQSERAIINPFHKANAALIVKAVNNFDALVALAEKVMAMTKNANGILTMVSVDDFAEVASSARSILSQVKGE